jgi:hypothetical protein
MLVSAILNASARKIGVIASGETLTAAEYADALIALQGMLRSWAAEKINVFATVSETHTLSSGTASYTWGTSGNINTARPNQIVSAFIRDSESVSHEVTIIGSGKYNSISDKTTTDRPVYLYPQFSYPLVTINLYPVPNTAETLVLESVKPFTETSSFSAIGDTLSMPVNYEEAIIYNMAIRLAPEFGVSAPAEVAAIARSSYDRLMTLNASNFVDTVNIDIPAGRVTADWYR